MEFVAVHMEFIAPFYETIMGVVPRLHKSQLLSSICLGSLCYGAAQLPRCATDDDDDAGLMFSLVM